MVFGPAFASLELRVAGQPLLGHQALDGGDVGGDVERRLPEQGVQLLFEGGDGGVEAVSSEDFLDLVEFEGLGFEEGQQFSDFRGGLG